MTWDEACQVFGIKLDASPQEIKERYNSLVQITHPDKHNGASEKTRKTAAEQFMRVQQAYEVLKDPANRTQGGAQGGTQGSTQGSTQAGVAVLEVRPQMIQFDDVEPLDARFGSFEVFYSGPPATEMFVGTGAPPFLTVLGCQQVRQDSPFPLKVQFQVVGQEAGRLYSAKVPVRINLEVAEACISLGTSQPGQWSPPNPGYQPFRPAPAAWPASRARQVEGKYRHGFTAAAVFLGIGLGFYLNLPFLSTVSTGLAWLAEVIALLVFWQVKHLRNTLLVLAVIPLCSTLAILNPGFFLFQQYPAFRLYLARTSSALGGAILAGPLAYYLLAAPLSRLRNRDAVLTISLVTTVIMMVLGIRFAL